ncbi:hypothetical protein JOE40_000475 [Arthrobacter sp. PvP102]|uniref:IS3 family transposase n=1 Tax=unclassified Arthrobacter TaxID=235627 RepID=UPI001B6BA6FA|nr:hypothetical protein [Arthrobacter sp. PvP103]MBP1235966.1 hypothetical protein [Arthrobacter sp. PvP102]
MVIGLAMTEHMRASLCTAALRIARNRDHFAQQTAVLHSDRGAPKTPRTEFQRWCADHRVTQSIGPFGVCWDNAVAETFFSHLKTEFYHHERFGFRLAARTAVMDYIEGWYNRRLPNRRPAASCQRRPTQTTEHESKTPWRLTETKNELSNELDDRSLPEGVQDVRERGQEGGPDVRERPRGRWGFVGGCGVLVVNVGEPRPVAWLGLST